MVFNKNTKKGQAAIEFLMTYGWMLLVVLIVGALIFSFVDFSSLLPNKLDLSNNLRGSPTDSIAYSGGYAGNQANTVIAVFTYTGPKLSTIGITNAAATDSAITTSLGAKCYAYNVTNTETKGTQGCTDGGPNQVAAATGLCAAPFGNPVNFLNGQTGIVKYKCPTATQLLKSDAVDGNINIIVTNPQTGLNVPSAGPIRLSITQ